MMPHISLVEQFEIERITDLVLWYISKVRTSQESGREFRGAPGIHV
jgi:hypothetical protein